MDALGRGIGVIFREAQFSMSSEDFLDNLLYVFYFTEYSKDKVPAWIKTLKYEVMKILSFSMVIFY